MTIIRLFGLYLSIFLCLSSAAKASSKPEEIMPMLGCYACHRLDGKGSQLGPSLAGIGQRMTRQELYRTLMSHGPTDLKRHMPSYNYLFESELQQLLDLLEQQ